MQLMVAICASVFLVAETRVFPDEVGINSPSIKLVVVLSCLFLLGYLGKAGEMDAKLDVQVKHDNLFVATSSTPYEEGSVVNGATLAVLPTTPTSSPTELEGSFEVVTVTTLDSEEVRYTVRRVTPTTKYEVASPITDEEVFANGGKGAAVLLGVAFLTGSVTILGTSKKEWKTGLLYFCIYMAFALLLAMPGFLPHTVS